MRSAAAVAAALAACIAAASEGIDDGALAGRCARGFAAECRELGRARLLATAADVRLGAALATKACELGDAAACADLGVLYALGRGVAQSDARATALARRACDQGVAIGCSNLGALLAEGAAASRPGEPADAHAVRLFRTACDAGVPAGCANLGTALAAGRLAPRDLRGAARALRRACDADLALACHRLAVLASEHPDAAPDVDRRALESRACRAAIAPACATIGEATPAATPRTPAAHLVADPGSLAIAIPGTGGSSPAELSARAGPARPKPVARERPSTALLAALPPQVQDRLGLGPPARDGDAADPPVDLLVALRRQELGACEEAPRAGPRRAAEAFAVFSVDPDGRAAAVRATTVPADAALEACARDVVAGWDFPAPADGPAGPYLARWKFEAAPGPAPELAASGALRPALRDPGCVDRALVVPAEYRGSTGAATVKLAVDPNGAPGLVHALAPVPEPLLAAISDAVRRCAWIPGAGEGGRRAGLWTTLTVRIDGR